MQRHRHAQPLRLADERAGDQLDLGRASRLDVLEHRRIVGAAAPRREHVHLPRVLVQPHPGGGRDRLALVHERVHEMAEVAARLLGGEVRVVRQPGERRNRVDGRVEDQLRPLRRPQIRERTRLQAGALDQGRELLDRVVVSAVVRAEPRLGVEDVLDVGVVVAGAAHEGDAGDDRPVAVATDDPLRTEPVLNRDDRRVREASLECRRRRVERGSLRRDDRDVELRDLVRIVRRANRAAELGAPGHPQPLRLKRAGVLAAGA